MGFFLLSGATAGLPAAGLTMPTIPNYTVTLTAYNAVPEQTDSDPFVTASGAYSNPEVVAARSQDLKAELPFGTIIALEGPSDEQNKCGYDIVAPIIGYRIIADVMNARYTDRIDLLFSTTSNYRMKGGQMKNAGNVLGICNGVNIRVVGHLDGKRPGKFPKTQAELAAIVLNGSALAIAK